MVTDMKGSTWTIKWTVWASISGVMERERLFVDDDFVGPSSVCDVPAAKQAAQQAVGAANLACGFKSQPKANKLDVSQTGRHERSLSNSHTDAFKKRHVSSLHSS